MEIKTIEVGENLLAENSKIAEENSVLLKEKGIVSFNLMGSPGSGKTKILERTLFNLKKDFPIGVIEGDIAGSYDSERLKGSDIPVVQINTGGACHLEALMIKKGLENLPLDEIKILFVENVGNLVCPAEFELGITKNVIVSSITEGEEKAAKYPLMFRISHIGLLNKMDLIDYISFDIKKFEEYVHNVNSGLKVFKVSAETGENFNLWLEYIKSLINGKS